VGVEESRVFEEEDYFIASF